MKNFRGSAIIFSAIAIVGANSWFAKAQTQKAQTLPIQAKPASQTSSFQLPLTRGAFSVGTTSYHLVDSSRKESYRSEVYDIRTQRLITSLPKTDRRELMIYVWYPAKAQSKAKTAPYIDEGFALASAESFGSAFGVPPVVFVKLVTQTVQTNSIAKAAPVQSNERYPVVIFSPGFGATPKWYTSQIEQLVSQGYIVVGLNPTYEAPAVFPGGRVLTQSSVFDFKSTSKDVEFRTFNEATAIRAKDVSFVLNELQRLNQKDPQGLLTGRLNLSRVGIIGHSLGANTAVEAMRIEPRIKAGISMDCGEYGELFKQQSKQRLNRPLMVMSREQQEVWSQLLYERVNADAYKLRIKGSVHNTFIDFGLIFPLFAANSTESEPPMEKVLGSIEPQQAARIIDDYTLAFFNQYLKSKNNSLLRRALPPYPEVVIESKITH